MVTSSRMLEIGYRHTGINTNRYAKDTPQNTVLVCSAGASIRLEKNKYWQRKERPTN